MAEHGLEPPLLGIAWDGSGLGGDNTLWGGEFLLIHDNGFLGLCRINQYEGQAAMALEYCAARVQAGVKTDTFYPFRINETEPKVIDWQMTIEQLLSDITRVNPELIADKFHNTLSEIILTVAQHTGQQNIVLSGGCFQNACLVEKAAGKLKTAGFNVYCHEKIPPNDGGLALGQLYAAKYIG